MNGQRKPLRTSKLGSKIDTPGEVPPRVLRGTINEAAFCEDALAANYLGGILASSRGEGKRDDRGVVMNALVSRLSVYQLRTHYLVYYALKDLFDGTNMNFFSDGPENGVIIPTMTYLFAMNFHSDELKDGDSGEQFQKVGAIIEHTFFGLYKEQLIGRFQYALGEPSQVSVQPSRTGIELFLWAHGYGDCETDQFLSPDKKIPLADGIMLTADPIPIVGDDGQSTGEAAEGYRYFNTIGLTCPVRNKGA